jgi:hypothetical protein
MQANLVRGLAETAARKHQAGLLFSVGFLESRIGDALQEFQLSGAANFQCSFDHIAKLSLHRREGIGCSLCCTRS